jgi:DNA-binding PadR family transcriptional regulator
MEYHDLLSGFVRLHILHHAAEGEIYGQWIIEELARHEYRLSPGTLYPMLQAMEQRGYLSSHEDCEGQAGRRRRVYRATAAGKKGLALARKRLRELVGEVGGRDAA